MKEDKLEFFETHPLEPFLPENAKLLLLGSFPPPKKRWSMEFYYPNFQNDMWRIIGAAFYRDKDYFIQGKQFLQSKIVDFCRLRGIALSDTGYQVYRTKGNASDQYLQIAVPIDIASILKKLPHCCALAATGGKAAETLAQTIPELKTLLKQKSISGKIYFHGKNYDFYRMPSTSRAYPKTFKEKLSAYEAMFQKTGLL